jgi:PST family polysaccharide transporter
MMTAMLLYLFMQYRWAFRREDFFNFRESIFDLALSMGKRNVLVCLSAFAGVTFDSINQIILKFYWGTKELGGYAAAWQITLLTTIMLLQVSRIAKPVTASVTGPGVGRKNRIEYLLKYSASIILIVTPICIPLVFFPKMILTTLFRPEYASAAEVLRVMGFYIWIIGIGLVFSEYIISRRMEKLYFASNFLGSGLCIILCFALIPKFSGLGAALSLLIGHGIAIFCYFLGVIKDIGIKNPPA